MSDGQPASAVDALVHEHYGFVYRYAFRLCGSVQDAEDLTQQAFLSAQRSLGQLRSQENARAWLAAIARNAYRRSFRSPGWQGAVPLDSIPEPGEEPPTEAVVDADELKAALAELPEEFRSPLVLYYQEHLGYREIAAVMDVPIGTVMSRLSRGKAHLRRRLLRDLTPVPDDDAEHEQQFD
jgi:RNA polymerase sigma-70 factor (ECF subfamily)